MAESIREPELDALVFEIGSGLYQLAAGAPPSLFDGRGLKGRIVARALEDEPLRAALFRFIDTLPQFETASDVATHFFAYRWHRTFRQWRPGRRPGLSQAVHVDARGQRKHIAARLCSAGC